MAGVALLEVITGSVVRRCGVNAWPYVFVPACAADCALSAPFLSPCGIQRLVKDSQSVLNRPSTQGRQRLQPTQQRRMNAWSRRHHGRLARRYAAQSRNPCPCFDSDDPASREIPRLSLIHISEPTRRTPISYAVFCLKKKNKQQN